MRNEYFGMKATWIRKMRHSKHHIDLVNGIGKCGVPMWINGCPAGFCDQPAWGNQEANQMRYGSWHNSKWIPGYSSALTCYNHGGPEKQKETNELELPR
jgi:hypothetical protein